MELFNCKIYKGKPSTNAVKGETNDCNNKQESCPNGYLKQEWQISIHNNAQNVHVCKGTISGQSSKSTILKSIPPLLK